MSSRFRRRLLQHILIGAAAAALTLTFAGLFPKRDFISRASIGTAYAALFLTAVALLLGPCNVLWRRPNPVSFDLRRDAGIWAGISALLHTGVGLNVHLRGKMWLYFLDTHSHLRWDAFGFGNYTGLIAALVFALLLALSNDLSLRTLGATRWKWLQQWAYLAIGLTLAHAVLYQHVEKRTLSLRALLYAICAIVVSVQVVAARHRLRHRPRS
jgi:methionine sulfoxide reductase heme-binding subunit